MKKIIILIILAFTNALYSQNFNKLFKGIEIEDFEKVNLQLDELTKEKQIDSSIIYLANALIYSNKNYKDFNPVKSYEHLLTVLKSEKLFTKKFNGIIEKFDFNLDNIKIDIENKVFEFSRNLNTIENYDLIIRLCHKCSYLENAKSELEKLEYTNTINSNTIEKYNYFLQKYPSSKNVAVITDKRDLLIFNSSKNSISDLKDFIINYPNSSIKEKAISLINSLSQNLESVYYYENGNILEIGKYREDVKIGKWITNYNNGNVENISIYKNNMLDVEETLYSEEGEVISKNKYIDGNESFEDGEKKIYDENGKLKEIKNYKNGKLDGLSIKYGGHNNIFSEKNYKNGKLEGLSIEYDGTGQILTRINYSNGLKNGEYYSKSNGEITIENYLNDTLSGKFLKKNIYDKILFEGYYYNGDKVGEWLLPNNSGGNFSNGTVKYYDSNYGKLYKIVNYRNGKRNGEFKGYYNGVLCDEGSFLNDYANGKWVIKYENGRIKFKGFCSSEGKSIDSNKVDYIYKHVIGYDFDEFNIFFTGECEFYYEDGKPFFIGNFTNGEVNYYLNNGDIFINEVYKEGIIISRKEFNVGLKNYTRTCKFYYENKNISKIEMFYENTSLNEIGEDIGKLTFFTQYLSDKTSSIKIIIYNREIEVFNGFVSDNNLSNVEISKFQNGNLINYHGNFQKESEGQILNRNKVGLWKYYDEKGNIIETAFYSEDLIKTYYQDGVIKRVEKCKNQILNGESIEYFSNGKVKSIEYYLNGKKDCRLEY